ERRLKNLDYFKSVKVTPEPGSSSDRVVLNVDLEEKSTGDFSVSGGYSTADGMLGEVSVSERNLLGRGLFAKASVQYGQRTRGFSLSFVEPYLLDYRVALGLDFYVRKQTASSYVSYDSQTIGFSPRLGFQLREDLNLQLRYSISQSKIQLPYYLQNCNNFDGTQNYYPTPSHVLDGGSTSPGPGSPYSGTFSGTLGGNNCFADGEASIAVKRELANGAVMTSALGYTLAYNTLDNNKDPTTGILATLNQDFAGVGGDVKYIKTTGDVKLYTPVVSDVVALLHFQGGVLTDTGSGLRMLDHFQMGPNLVRGFAPVGIGPRDITQGTYNDALGGTKYWGASAELQMPFWFLPKEVGMKGAVYADAGSLWDYKGPTALYNNIPCNGGNQCLSVGADDGLVRASVGVGLIWQSPFGPLRFDYAIPVSKSPYDRVQQFRFGGGTSF
ncbi:MAG TPA: outer membrane protein assembly factor BamA, partial [Afipia sp.]